jgi:hypothetical protein
MGLTQASLVFGGELCLPCNLLFGAPPQQGAIHHQTHCGYDRLASRHPQLCLPTPETGHWTNENPLWPPGHLHILPGGWPSVAMLPSSHQRKVTQASASLEGPYRIVTWINDVVYRIQQHPRIQMMVAHLDRPAPYKGTAPDKQP